MKLLKTMSSLALLVGAPAAWAIPTAVQDFEDGTTQGWTAGGRPLGAAPPVLPAPAAGGPGGPADPFLRIGSGVGGGGSGSNLVAINRGARDGDYLAAGLGAVDDLLQSVTALRIWGTGDPNAVFRPADNRHNAVSGVLGVDKLAPDVFGIGGGVVPAPATAWLALLGRLGAGGARRWRRR